MRSDNDQISFSVLRFSGHCFAQALAEFVDQQDVGLNAGGLNNGQRIGQNFFTGFPHDLDQLARLPPYGSKPVNPLARASR